ncbi:MAG: FAD-dependent oxidoreductase [Rubrivivax sp.]|nr:FAD-dependent oxidoreductase [Rubrivivax sp.]
MRLAVVGAGWAGLAAAVRAVTAGHEVTLFEMAAQPGGRARSVLRGPAVLDNGQHILIGAYSRTLSLMRRVGLDPSLAFHRRPLELRYPDGRGLGLPRGPAALAFAAGVLRARGFSRRGKWTLLGAAAGWLAGGFRCAPGTTVDALCANLSQDVRDLLIDPLCVAALNTPARDASAAVLLRVLQDALFGGHGAADLLLPRRPLGELLPEPAWRWLGAAGAKLHAGQRVLALERQAGGWRVNDLPFDAVVLATTATEAARLTAEHEGDWSARAQALLYEPIITVYLQCPGARLPAPMTALLESARAPAQFAFDHGALGGRPGRFAFVVSGARAWTEAGLEATAGAVLAQAEEAFAPGTWPTSPQLLHVSAEKRATFRCVPGLDRPPARVAQGLVAAGDYIDGPYPATLEGAVRAGEQAVALLEAG